VKTAPERVIVYYQPIYSAGMNRIIGAEALMRIQDPLLGMLMPGEFIPAAEKAGLIGSLTEIMISHVCQFLVNYGLAFDSC
jgi:EAL domain-containing protein (putative c-di-GMP-specific phosphodiesterase class I)